MRRHAVFAAISAAFLGACGGDGPAAIDERGSKVDELTASDPEEAAAALAAVTVQAAGVRAPPRIVSFTATPAAIAPGGQAVLKWSVAGADAVRLAPDIGRVTGGSRVVAPAETTTYTLTARNTWGTATATVTVTVAVQSLPSIASFQARPAHIAPGGVAWLSWTVANADRVTIDAGVGPVSGRFREVSPTSTTTFTLTATNASGSTTASVTVMVSSIERVDLPDVTVLANGRIPLVADVTVAMGEPPLELDWWVEPGSLGAVTQPRGVSTTYVAPDVPGTYTVWAASKWEPSRRDSCQVKVVRRLDFSVDEFPSALASDGVHVWVAHETMPAHLSKVRASDGVVLGSYELDAEPFTTGLPALVHDGEHIWTAYKREVFEDGFPVGNVHLVLAMVRPSDGAVLARYTVAEGGTHVGGVAFDGENVWVSYVAGGRFVSKFRAIDGERLLDVDVGDGAATPIAYCGGYVWAGGGVDTVTKISATDGAVVALAAIPASYGVACDGANVWITSAFDFLYKLRASDGRTLGTFPAGPNPAEVYSDGEGVWVTNFNGTTVSSFRASDGAVLETIAVSDSPWGIAFDGDDLWIANYGSASLSKL
jgi:PKD repeat protein